MQDIIIKCPSETIGEDGLYYVDREVTTGSRRIDIVLKDRMGRYVLVEAQIGHLDTKHIDRHIDFSEGFIEKNPSETIRIMYIANMINPYQKEFLQKRGYEFVEISQKRLYDIAKNSSILVEKDGNVADDKITCSSVEHIKSEGATTVEGISQGFLERSIARIRDEYLCDQSFHTVRRESEAKAKEMLDTILNVASPTDKHIRSFLDYMNKENIKGKTALTRFGRHFTNILAPQICTSPETFKEWIGALWRAEENELQRALKNFLAKKPIKGADTLLPTFVLYLRKPNAYNIWTKNLEKNFYKTFSITEAIGNNQYEQYTHFNSEAFNRLITPFRLEPQEVDLVMSRLL